MQFLQLLEAALADAPIDIAQTAENVARLIKVSHVNN